MRLVTCSVTKEKIPIDEAYAVMQTTGRNKYYKNFKVYKNDVDKENFYLDIKLFTGMRERDKIPMEIYSFFNNLNASYSWTELYTALLYKASAIKEVRYKEFSTVSHKLLYVAKIIENGLVIVQQIEYQQHKEVDIDIDLYNEILYRNEIKHNKKTRRVLNQWKKGM